MDLSVSFDVRERILKDYLNKMAAVHYGDKQECFNVCLERVLSYTTRIDLIVTEPKLIQQFYQIHPILAFRFYG